MSFALWLNNSRKNKAFLPHAAFILHTWYLIIQLFHPFYAFLLIFYLHKNRFDCRVYIIEYTLYTACFINPQQTQLQLFGVNLTDINSRFLPFILYKIFSILQYSYTNSFNLGMVPIWPLIWNISFITHI